MCFIIGFYWRPMVFYSIGIKSDGVGKLNRMFWYSVFALWNQEISSSYQTGHKSYKSNKRNITSQLMYYHTTILWVLPNSFEGHSDPQPQHIFLSRYWDFIFFMSLKAPEPLATWTYIFFQIISLQIHLSQVVQASGWGGALGWLSCKC